MNPLRGFSQVRSIRLLCALLPATLPPVPPRPASPPGAILIASSDPQPSATQPGGLAADPRTVRWPHSSAASAPTREHLVTTDSPTIDLKLLRLLPPNTVVIHSTPLPNMPALVQLPPLASWHLRGTTLTITVQGVPHRRNELVSPRSRPSTHLAYTVSTANTGPHGTFTLTAKVSIGKNALPNGDLRHGVWGQVGNCHQTRGVGSNAVHASLLPNAGPHGLPALRLAASADTACESSALVTSAKGPFLLDLWTRRLHGSPPSMCLWQRNSRTCEPNALALPSSSRWQHYQSTIDLQSQTILFLYAGPAQQYGYSVDEYAAVSLNALPLADFPVAILAYPQTQP